ncbi:hypothetical protein CF640_37680 [Burkholderia pseudomallei]|nr:hypothetical protein CF640_37680 [Burkholderia pseudomallei]
MSARYSRIAPDSKIDSGAPLSIFESGAILLYLADKLGRFIPADLRRSNEALDGLLSFIHICT